jgi:carbon monoxide dehydrogenase subunit G
MLKGESSILIDRPPDDVWKFMADLQNTPKWDPGVLEIKQTSQGALGLGSTMQIVDMFLGSRKVLNIVITEWEDNETAAWTINAGFANGLARYRLEPAGKGSRLTRYVEMKFKGLYRLLEPLINFSGKIGRRSDRHEELDNVKRLVEARG